MEKTITLNVNGTDFDFHMTSQQHTAFVNETLPHNRVNPAFNLLMRVVDDEQKEDLKEILKPLPAISLGVVEKLMEEYMPDIRITVGKSKGPQSK